MLPHSHRSLWLNGRDFRVEIDGVGQMDVILYQRISGGWEYRYTRDGESYRGFDIDPAQARVQLLRQLGWDRWRFDRADFRRF